MVYNSFLFIWLFPIIFMVGNNLTAPYRKYFFLIVSYGIYIYYNKWMTLTLIAVSLISYFFAKYLERNQVISEKAHLDLSATTNTIAEEIQRINDKQ